MVKQFRHSDDLESATLECDLCGWKGTYWGALVDGDRDGQYIYCPNCRDNGYILASCMFPTVQELRESSRIEDRQMADIIDRNRRDFDSKRLSGPEQLPEIYEEKFALTWDCIGKELAAGGQGLETVIRHGEQVLYTEPAIFEGWWRYEQVARIMRQKYGGRVIDLIPTPASRLYLWGDDGTAPFRVQQVRKEVFGAEVGTDWIL